MRDANEIAQRLARLAPALCTELLPGGKRQGAEWRIGSIAGEPGQSLGVRLYGARAGVWSDFSTGEVGDALDLVAAVRFAGDKRAALIWARGFLGLAPPSGAATTGTHAAPATPPPAPPSAFAEQRDADAEQRRRSALSVFLNGQSDLSGTPVEAYLAGRGIDLAELRRSPRALRYHPALWNSESRQRLPAMVAAVVNGAGEHTATHRTWLARRDGRWTKAALAAPKMSLGLVAGGTVRLARGASGKPLALAAEGETVVIAEGIETALSVAMACLDLRVLAAVSLGNMGRLRLPKAIRTIIIAADNDPAGSPAERGLRRVIQHFGDDGRQVRLARSSIGKDFNDCIQVDNL